MENKYRTKKVILLWAKNIVKNKPWRLQQDSNLQPLSLQTNIQVNTAPVSSKKFLEIQATLECKFTLKRARDMMRTYSQINPSNKYVKQRLLYAYFEEKYFTSSTNIS